MACRWIFLLLVSYSYYVTPFFHTSLTKSTMELGKETCLKAQASHADTMTSVATTLSKILFLLLPFSPLTPTIRQNPEITQSQRIHVDAWDLSTARADSAAEPYYSERSIRSLDISSLTSVDSIPRPRKAPRPHVYSVEFSDPPSLLPRTPAGEESALDRLAHVDIVVIGKHRRSGDDTDNSGPDATLESSLFTRLHQHLRGQPRSLTLGLTDLPNTPDLKVESEAVLIARLGTSLSAAGVGPRSRAEVLPVLKTARHLGVPVVALGVPNTGDLAALPLDPVGISQSARDPGFLRYVDMALREDYEQFILSTKEIANPDSSSSVSSSSNKKVPISTFEEYVGSRILDDEIVASAAAAYSSENRDRTLILLADGPAVRFGFGIQERAIRNLNALLTASTPLAQLTVNTVEPEPSAAEPKPALSVGPAQVLSVLLNPTPVDSGGRTAQLRLSLAYAGKLPQQRPLANYLWYESDPPVRYLTRPKNAISREGDLPPGESSMLGVF